MLSIVDDEVTLQFSAATYTASEGGLKATITVKRSGPTSSVVGGAYATSDGTAIAGSDYTATDVQTAGPPSHCVEATVGRTRVCARLLGVETWRVAHARSEKKRHASRPLHEA